VKQKKEDKGLPNLRQPIEIGGRLAPNRLVMPPLVTLQAEADGSATQGHFDHYGNSLGPGLVVVEATAVSPEGRITATQLGLYDDRHISGFRRLSRIIHGSGALAAVQIHHGGAKAGWEDFPGLKRLAPSGSTTGGGRGGDESARSLSEADIRRIIDDFVSSAARAAEAEFDIVEIHGAHGYLVNQFLSPRTNRRNDRWGGSLENRMRFLLTILEEIRELVKGECLLGCRLGIAERGEKGFSLDEGLTVARRLEEAGLALLDISHGGSMPEGIKPPDSPFSALLHLSQRVRQVVSIPIIGVGGIKTPGEAETALEAAMADLVAVGRGILADPGWAEKAFSGKPEKIFLCQRCRRCLHFTDPALCPARKAALKEPA
jgi:2,4-dienoyl-CoA reductase-like NADH-dependent reductase (Old Yellow Enzyme family)